MSLESENSTGTASLDDHHPLARTGPALALAGVACIVLWLGWRLFWFLTDDAFIAFRYASNSVLGRGYTWNPPPFRPVEGYTSFLWVALLDVVWRFTGIEPPRAANVLSLISSCGSLLLTALIGSRMDLRGPLRRHRAAAIAFLLAALVTHRTFITWTSSGLETALFNFLTLAWLFALLFGDGAPRRWVFFTSLTAALAALARPDGIIAVAATCICLARAAQRRDMALGKLAFAFPLLAVPAHLLWRRATYGAWLPNTYYAKTTGLWPQSGARYLLSFTIEYTLWIWLALVALWLWRELRPRRRASARRERIAWGVAAFALPFAYYTFVIGGDHFEYRVYSGLVPLLALTTLFFVDRLALRAPAAFGVLALSLVAALPIPWVHFMETRQLTTRKATEKLAHPVAQRFPWPLRPYVALFDRLQGWLIPHFVGTRHQEHKVFAQWLLFVLPPRSQGERVSWDTHPVLATDSVGVVAWTYPHVAAIDTLGLNDHVIARSEVHGAVRQMAHERKPPSGYVECFKPNFNYAEGRIVRPGPTDEEIRACENRWWARREENRPQLR